MRYKVLLWPLLDQTLAVVTTSYDQKAEAAVQYKRQIELKTKGPDWDLPGLLRELADRLDESAF